MIGDTKRKQEILKKAKERNEKVLRYINFKEFEEKLRYKQAVLEEESFLRERAMAEKQR
jgi:hypothetical protein